MKAPIRLAVIATGLALAAGCSGNMRHGDRSLRDPVRLPGAPNLESSPPTTPGPNMTGPTPSPLSTP